RILVTGVSGTGKSSALAELARRGFRTLDTEEPGWTVLRPLRRRRAPQCAGGRPPRPDLEPRHQRLRKSLEERELILAHLREIEPLLRATCTHEIDATQPLSEVVERLVRIGRHS